MPAFVNTELTAGTTELKGVKRSTPEDVAEAVVDALQYGRFEVFVPKSLVGLVRSAALTPRSFSEWLGRKMGGASLLERRQERPRGLRAARGQERARPPRRWWPRAAADEPKTPAAA